ncbi:hypothetical protein UZ35_16630 [Heyndrickxia coagulans]|nr:hypothetical protein CIW84_13560 [Heyndrickxia coagulans]KXT19159.1 hypothetical protein UZ35_16630 [Heyndrickxia coagulans]OZV93170.1 hypothetical protein CAY57_14870 [Heyndrickxia coagulans]RCS34720.1 hypothetical protein DN050_17315 [Heyndrickxia coagulans]
MQNFFFFRESRVNCFLQHHRRGMTNISKKNSPKKKEFRQAMCKYISVRLLEKAALSLFKVKVRAYRGMQGAASYEEGST